MKDSLPWEGDAHQPDYKRTLADVPNFTRNPVVEDLMTLILTSDYPIVSEFMLFLKSQFDIVLERWEANQLV